MLFLPGYLPDCLDSTFFHWSHQLPVLTQDNTTAGVLQKHSQEQEKHDYVAQCGFRSNSMVFVVVGLLWLVCFGFRAHLWPSDRCTAADARIRMPGKRKRENGIR